MSSGLELPLAVFCGLLLGLFFFGGLWWTVRRGILSERPALWFFGSLLIRTTGALAGFYAVSQGEWRRVLACLLGFLMARFAVVRVSREHIAPPAPATRTSP